jgi:hypothetical protein
MVGVSRPEECGILNRFNIETIVSHCILFLALLMALVFLLRIRWCSVYKKIFSGTIILVLSSYIVSYMFKIYDKLVLREWLEEKYNEENYSVA